MLTFLRMCGPWLCEAGAMIDDFCNILAPSTRSAYILVESYSLFKEEIFGKAPSARALMVLKTAEGCEEQR